MLEEFKKVTVKRHCVSSVYAFVAGLVFSLRFIIHLDDMLAMDSVSQVLLSGDNVIYIICFIVGIIFWIRALFEIVKALTGGYLWQLKDDINKAGYSTTDLELDYQGSLYCGQFRLGRQMFYFWEGENPRAYSVRRILWIYSGTVKTSQGLSMDKGGITIYVDKRFHPVVYKHISTELVDDILKEIAKRYPWVMIGYSNELAELYRNKRNDFKELKYNKEIEKAQI